MDWRVILEDTSFKEAVFDICMNKVPAKKENNMYYDDCGNELNKEARAENYLLGRLGDLEYSKNRELEKAFGIVDDDRPPTLRDFLQRIQEGKITYSEESLDREEYNPLRFIRWRDPNVKEDRAGFIEAHKLLAKAKTEVKDVIYVKTPEEALTALKEFESKTFH